MNINNKSSAEDILKRLQRGIEINYNPFDFSDEGWSSSEVVKLINESKNSGIIRRFGAVFDSGALGYKSTLCAVQILENQIEEIKYFFEKENGVTHAYIREGEPNLWFTYTGEIASFDQELQRLNSFFSNDIVSMPATKRFKIRAVFDGKSGDNRNYNDLQPLSITEKHKEIIRFFQDDLIVTENIFGFYAEKLGVPKDELLDCLSNWQKYGALRRIAAVVRHRSVGVKGNAMCAWNVESEKVEYFGKILAGMPEVSHCYERDVPEDFSYNLFAMLHGKNIDEINDLFAQLEMNGLENGKKFTSVVEIKKSSPKYFV